MSIPDADHLRQRRFLDSRADLDDRCYVSFTNYLRCFTQPGRRIDVSGGRAALGREAPTKRGPLCGRSLLRSHGLVNLAETISGSSGSRAGFAKYVLGGWSIVGVTTFQSGTPYTVGNSTDRNNDTILADRPDIGNPTAPWNSRGVDRRLAAPPVT